MFKDGSNRPGKFTKLNTGVPSAFAELSILEGFERQKRTKDRKELKPVKSNAEILLDVYGSKLKKFQRILKRNSGHSFFPGIDTESYNDYGGLYDFREDISSRTNPLKKFYDGSESLVSKLNIVQKDIMLFNQLVMPLVKQEGFSRTFGVFLSAVLNNSKSNSFDLDFTSFDDEMISFIGYRNTKNLKVTGNLGDCVAYKMRSGKLEVIGNTADKLAEDMSGGELLVRGNVRRIPRSLDEGIIRINGSYRKFSSCIK